MSDNEWSEKTRHYRAASRAEKSAGETNIDMAIADTERALNGLLAVAAPDLTAVLEKLRVVIEHSPDQIETRQVRLIADDMERLLSP